MSVCFTKCCVIDPRCGFVVVFLSTIKNIFYVLLLYREDPGDSYLDDKDLKQASSQSSVGEHPKFTLSFKDDL